MQCLYVNAHQGESVQYKSPDGAQIGGIFIPGDRAPNLENARGAYYHNRPFCSNEQKFLYDQIGEILKIEPPSETTEFGSDESVHLET